MTHGAPQLVQELEKSAAAIDMRTLRLYVGDDERALHDFLGRFFDRLGGDMDQLRRTTGAQRWVDAARLAHRMRASALAIGAAGFALLCTQIEAAALAPDIDAALAGLGALEDSFIAVQKAVMEAQHAGQ
jgi:HPt (histidine-containing phosphotransfer) domain-containing protein